MANWNAAFTTWLLNAKRFAPAPRGYQKPPGELDHEARRLEANAAREHREALMENARSGLYGSKVQRAVESGAIDGTRLEAIIAERKAARNGDSRPRSPAPAGGLVQAALAGIRPPVAAERKLKPVKPEEK